MTRKPEPLAVIQGDLRAAAPHGPNAGETPSMPAEALERLALAVSRRLRGRLAAMERRAETASAPDARGLAHDQMRELEWLLGRIDLHVAIARDRHGQEVDLDPALHRLLTANGKLLALIRSRPRGPRTACDVA